MGEEEEHTALREGTSAGRTAAAAASILRRRGGDLEAGARSIRGLVLWKWTPAAKRLVPRNGEKTHQESIGPSEVWFAILVREKFGQNQNSIDDDTWLPAVE
jgi:hypothetical protein